MKNTSGRLYRIMNFHHAVQLFEKNVLYFSHPSVWDDPYETKISHNRSNNIYAQSWCSEAVSDAMWRIYSPHHLGVRIGTSTKKLMSALSRESKKSNFQFKMKDVVYETQFQINKKMNDIAQSLSNGYDFDLASESLFMKRKAYEHESEYRVVIEDNNILNNIKLGKEITINAMTLIDSILIDPRAPNELSDALIYYFKEKIGFSKKVKKSVLYKEPKKLIIP